jgi:hypothetical protein
VNLAHIDQNIELLLEFACLSPAIAPYEELALQRGLRVVEDEIAPEYRLIKGEQFGLMLVDRSLARLHVAGLFIEEEDSSGADALGITVVSSGDQLAMVYEHVLELLSQRLGSPAVTKPWPGKLPLGSNDTLLDHEFSCCAWRFEEPLLILLMNDEGDTHIGEEATVDLRIAPRRCEDALPDSVKDLFGWPVEY